MDVQDRLKDIFERAIKAVSKRAKQYIDNRAHSKSVKQYQDQTVEELIGMISNHDVNDLMSFGCKYPLITKQNHVLIKAAIETNDNDLYEELLNTLPQSEENDMLWRSWGEHSRSYYTHLGYALFQESDEIAAALIIKGAPLEMVSHQYNEDYDKSYDHVSALEYLEEYKSDKLRHVHAQLLRIHAAELDKNAETALIRAKALEDICELNNKSAPIPS